MDYYITFKNIYNFAKSLCHYEKKTGNKSKYAPYPKYWRSLTNDDKNEILNRVNNIPTDAKWFNIMRYLKRVREYRSNIQNFNIFIFEGIRNKLTQIIFDVLTNQGILSQFVPEPSITDDSQLPNGYAEKGRVIKDRLKKLLFENRYYKQIIEESKYFITDTNYKDLKITFEENGREVKKTYLEYLKTTIFGF